MKWWKWTAFAVMLLLALLSFGTLLVRSEQGTRLAHWVMGKDKVPDRIVLVTLDTLRADHTSPYGYH